MRADEDRRRNVLVRRRATPPTMFVIASDRRSQGSQRLWFVASSLVERRRRQRLSDAAVAFCRPARHGQRRKSQRRFAGVWRRQRRRARARVALDVLCQGGVERRAQALVRRPESLRRSRLALVLSRQNGRDPNNVVDQGSATGAGAVDVLASPGGPNVVGASGRVNANVVR